MNALNHLTCNKKEEEEEIVGVLQEKETTLLQEGEDGEKEEGIVLLQLHTATLLPTLENHAQFSSDNSLGTSTTIGSKVNSQNVVQSSLLE